MLLKISLEPESLVARVGIIKLIMKQMGAMLIKLS
jgi:hypothetical protein